MDKRKIKVMIHKAGGNASKNALNYRISLPPSWMKEMNIELDDREVDVSFNGETIIIKKIQSKD